MLKISKHPPGKLALVGLSGTIELHWYSMACLGARFPIYIDVMGIVTSILEDMMAKKPYVDKDICIGCELCVGTAPDVFRMTDENVAEVFDPFGAPEETIQEAIDNCPVNCIHWE